MTNENDNKVLLDKDIKDLDNICEMITARGIEISRSALPEILGTPEGQELLLQVKMLQKAEEEQRKMLAEANGIKLVPSTKPEDSSLLAWAPLKS